ncbi:hypothetical protein GCM10022232_14200 [Streptomyces plumbiresistens]|uniref:Uncharacterized protein n=1 Tax=Streptomyces plumbiresistens TaxID=511811 RepID=A0ABP7QI76_9ACTN
MVHSGAVEARSAAISLRPVAAPCIPEATVRMGTAERKFADAEPLTPVLREVFDTDRSKNPYPAGKRWRSSRTCFGACPPTCAAGHDLRAGIPGARAGLRLITWGT